MHDGAVAASAPDSSSDYQFSNRWFSVAQPTWERLFPKLDPTRILEIGSYEGASTCFLIDHLAAHKDVEIHCVDTWEGGVEHKGSNMSAVEQRFQANTSKAIGKAAFHVNLNVHKATSDIGLARLLAEGRGGYFDFVYVDGSHQAPDVLLDAVLSFKLTRVGGVIAFDDYLWAEKLPYGTDPIRCPKPAIDAFTNLFCRKITVMHAPFPQLYVRKTSD